VSKLAELAGFSDFAEKTPPQKKKAPERNIPPGAFAGVHARQW
jgi:hypothetical protein